MVVRGTKGWLKGVVAVRSCWKLLLSLVEPMTVGSRTELPKAEPTGTGGSTSVMRCFRRGTNPAQMEKGVRVWRETALQTPGSRKGAGGASGTGAEIPPEAQGEAAVPLQHLEVHGGAEIHLQDPRQSR